MQKKVLFGIILIAATSFGFSSYALTFDLSNSDGQRD